MTHQTLNFKPMLFFGVVLFLCNCQNQAPAAQAEVESAESTTRQVVEKPKPRQYNFSLDYLMGKFEPAKHPDFTKIEIQYADREGMYARKDTYESFKKMWAAAKADDITLTIRSAARNFDYQKGIWERKWTGTTKIENGKDASHSYPDPKTRALKILEYSSMPSTSRHHWGTDLDFNNFENSYFEKGQGLKEYQWLVANAAKYGFCQVYSEKGADRPHGYNLEKWHWSYLPVAKELTLLAKDSLKDVMIEGFQGAEVAEEIGVVEKYVLGISPDCQ